MTILERRGNARRRRGRAARLGDSAQKSVYQKYDLADDVNAELLEAFESARFAPADLIDETMPLGLATRYAEGAKRPTAQFRGMVVDGMVQALKEKKGIIDWFARFSGGSGVPHDPDTCLRGWADNFLSR